MNPSNSNVQQIKGQPGREAGRLTPSDYFKQAEVDEQLLQYKEIQSFVILVTSKCFKTCINAFDSPTMLPDEKVCLDNCIMRAQKSQNEANQCIPEVDKRFM